MSDDTEPLLRSRVASDGQDGRHCHHRLLPLSRRQFVTILAYVFMFTVRLSSNILAPAFNSMLEDVLCREQFGSSMLANDPRCKADEVQRRLAAVRGWQTSLDCLPAILLTIPYGILADKVGRQPVLFLSALGLFLQMAWTLVVFYLSLPVWATYLSSLWTCIGCFQSVGPAMLYTILADVTPKADRADCFFGLVALLLVADIVGNPLGGLLLLWGNWLPLLLGTAGLGVGVLVVLPLPETAEKTALSDDPDVSSAVSSDVSSDVSSATAPKSLWRQAVQTLRADARDTWHFVWGDRRLALLLVSLVFLVAGAFVQELLLQYTTKRYGLSWSRAAFLLTARSCANLLVFLALPVLGRFCMRRRGWSARTKDLRLARLCGLLGSLGALLLALAPTPALLCVALVVFSGGGGFGVLLRSLLSALVEPHHLAILNSMVGLLEYAGLMVTSPLLFRALQTGVELGGAWMGLPFLCAAGLAAVGTGLVCCVHVEEEEEAEEAEV